MNFDGRLAVARTVLTILAALAAAAPVRGAVITVTGTGDGVAADGACTLREAIQAANTDADVNECTRTGAADPDEIHFAIAGAGPHVIQPTDVLPQLASPVVVDGTTQPGSVCPGVLVVVGEGQMVPSPGDLRIVVNGALAGPADGLALLTGDSIVRGLVINGFADGFGIRVEGSNNRIECNFIGTDAAGSTADANLDGVGIVPTEGIVTANVVGVSGGVGFRNVISGNLDNGVVISFTDGNMVSGNYIGTSADGTAALGNTIGVNLDFGDENVVGTDSDAVGDAGERNVIAANTVAGVQVEGAGNVVAGNFIGTNAAGNCHTTAGCDVGNGIGVVLGFAPFPDLRTPAPAADRAAVAAPQEAADEALVKENLIAGNGTGILVTFGEVDVPFAAGSSDNCVVANGDGVVNDLQVGVVFEDNWWGAADGPSPPGGTGSGDSVVGSVDFDPFLTAPAAVCSGTVTIVKDAVPDDPQDFAFTRQREGSAAVFGFVLDDDGGADATNPASRSFVLEAGVYEVTEADPTGFGFALTAVDCVDSDAGGLGSTGDRGARTASVRLEPGETVTCTFTDTRFSGIDLEKSTNGVDADAPPGPAVPVGSPVAWTYVVTNTGEVPLSAIAVTDDQGVAVSCPKATLAVGEAMTCTAAGTAAAGLYRNVGTAAGKTPDGRDAVDSDPSHYLGVVEGAAIDVEKYTNGFDADLPPGPSLPVGSPVTWTYVVTNSGDAPLTDVTVIDDHGVAITCGTPPPPPEGGGPPPPTQPFSLAVGESVVCTATGTATAGQYANLATAQGTAPDESGVEATDPSHYFGEAPEAAAIDLEKATNGFDADAPPGPVVPVGSPVAWTYVVTNTGAVALSQVAVSDDQGVAVSCPKTALAPGEAMTCTAAGVAAAGLYANLGTVAAKTPAGGTAVGSDPSHYLGQVDGPAIDVEKATDGFDADAAPGPTIGVGDPVTWTYLVANAGTAALAGVTVVDDQGVTVFCGGATPPPEGDPPVTGQPFSLAVGELVTCQAFGTAVAGQYANLATATGTPDGGSPVEASDPSHYFGGEAESPAVDLQKSTNGVDADLAPGPTVPAGDPVAWTYRVTNTGDAGLTGVTVSDDQGEVVSCPQTTLAVGETMTCTAAGTATAGQYANVGSVSATSTGGQAVGASDPSHYFGIACFTGPTATGAGDATLCYLGEAPGCGLVDVAFIPLEGDVQSPPAGSAPPGVVFPFGLFTFGVGPDCSPGFTATFTLTLPSPPPAGTKYWKYGPTPGNMVPHWYELPAMTAGNVITFSITDGGVGDHDLAADGKILDPGGPGAPQFSVVEIPTLGAGPLALLAVLLALAAVAALRRRRTG